jgi:rhodanese-related sulfurtransferase
VDWNKKFPSVQMPKQDDLLVFISTRGKRAGRAAAIASNLGYSGYATFSVDVSGSSATFMVLFTVLPMCSALEF